MKFKFRTRDWKGSYHDSSVKGWELFATENEINTGKDCFTEIYIKDKCEVKITGQDIYDIYESLLCGDVVDGYVLDEKEDSILIKKYNKKYIIYGYFFIL